MANDLWSQYQEKLQPITRQSESLLRDYLALQAQAPTFQQKLLDAIKQAGQWPSHAELRAEYAQRPNLTPMAIEALVSRRGQAQRGTIQDIISRATGGFQADIASRQARADIAQRQKENLLQEYGLAREARQVAAPITLAEGATLFDPTTGQPIYKAPKTYKGTTQPDLSWLENLLPGVPGAEAPTEPKPTAKPTRRDVQWRSPEGQWMWDHETQDWYPVSD